MRERCLLHIIFSSRVLFDKAIVLRTNANMRVLTRLYITHTSPQISFEYGTVRFHVVQTTYLTTY